MYLYVNMNNVMILCASIRRKYLSIQPEDLGASASSKNSARSFVANEKYI